MTYEVIVVGGGIGGLTTAALLAARGVNVGLFERQSEIGGCVANFEHLGYAFEPTAGLYSGWEPEGTWNRIFSQLPGAPPTVHKLSPNYVVRLPDSRDIAVGDDGDRLEADLRAAFPDSSDAAIKFFRTLDASDQVRNSELVASLLRDLPSNFRLFVDVQLQTLAQRTSAECSVATAAEVLAAARRGMWSMDGGGQALANRLAENLRQSGGALRLNSPVLRLAFGTDGNPIGIDLLSGERVTATRAIVSNLTVWDTYGKLFGLNRTPKSISAELRKMRAWGAYLLFLGMDEGATARLSANRMLAATVANEDEDTPERQQLTFNAAPEWDRRAPSGKRAVTVATFTPAEDWFTFHEDETSHEAQDQATLEACWTRLHSAMPELGDSIEVIETATPRTFYETTRRKFGMVGARLGSSNLFPPADGFGKTPFPNMFMVGDTVCSGFGLDGVAESAMKMSDFLFPNR